MDDGFLTKLQMLQIAGKPQAMRPRVSILMDRQTLTKEERCFQRGINQEQNT